MDLVNEYDMSIIMGVQKYNFYFLFKFIKKN